jgi:hypothetical protein
VVGSGKGCQVIQVICIGQKRKRRCAHVASKASTSVTVGIPAFAGRGEWSRGGGVTSAMGRVGESFSEAYLLKYTWAIASVETLEWELVDLVAFTCAIGITS